MTDGELARELARDVVNHHLPGQAYDPESNSDITLLAEHIAGTFSDWLIGDLDLTTREFIDLIRTETDFDMGEWLDAHSDEINLD